MWTSGWGASESMHLILVLVVEDGLDVSSVRGVVLVQSHHGHDDFVGFPT